MAALSLPAARQWISKTDLSRYYRCPYSFWLLDSGQITFEETIDRFTTRLIEGGQEYQRVVEESAVPVVIAAGELDELLQTKTTILGTPLFKNRRLKILGCPDGIDAGCGALYPVEIKSHRAPTKLDGLELAFYWLLLEPRRTRKADPEGVLILRRDGAPVTVRVPITGPMLAEVRQLIRNIRMARRHGVQPRVCGCVVCAGIRRDEVIASVTSRRDVSMVLGVGPVYGRALASCGHVQWDSLPSCDPANLAGAVTATGARGCTDNMVRRWQLHARALASGQPVLRAGAVWPVKGPYIALDLEYDPSPDEDHIWLAGAAVAEGESAEHRHWWAGTQDDVPMFLAGLAGLLGEYPYVPVVTWAGLSADLPRLRSACARHGLPRLAGVVFDRHVDAYQWCVANLRLPTISLGLKEASEYFGYHPSSGISDGLEALMLFNDWQKNGDERIPDRLVAYNRDDVSALVAIVARVGELCADESTPRA